jgi:hypothetical protein
VSVFVPTFLRRVFLALRFQSPVLRVVVIGWFLATTGLILWGEGIHPRTFMTPDEAANRFAASQISKTGRPFLPLPFADPEDIAHPRAWLSQGAVAIPIYPPVAIYFYALLTSLRRPGSIALALLPASAVAAFVLGVARLLPSNRKWLAALAPALGMPVLYWLSRPWMNICGLLTCVCWAFNCWTRWRQDGSRGWLALAMLFVSAAAAVRPDYTAYLLLIALLLGVSVEPKAWKLMLLLTFVAGALALVANLVLNRLITGNPFRAAYQLAMDSDPGVARPSNLVIRLLRPLFFPMTFAGWHVVRSVLYDYWVGMQPEWLLLLGQLALLPLLIERRPLERVALLASILLALLFMISRVDPELFGLSRGEGFVQDSLPRYWSPVYLLASVPPLLVLGRTRWRSLYVVGSLAMSLLAAGNLVEIVWLSTQSVIHHHVITTNDLIRLEKIDRLVPRDAMVYSPTYDKVLWSRYHVGFVEDPDKTASSMLRALAKDMPVYFWAHSGFDPDMLEFQRALRKQALLLVSVDQPKRLYKVIAGQR